jgi:ribosomal protein S18 acetylase RimI-like enzyme
MRDAGGFSYRNAHIAEIGGAVAGLLLGYPLTGNEDPSEAPPQVRALVELELEAPRHWYVNILAVYPEFRRRGIGGRLLGLADNIGAKDCPGGMAIIVASANDGARRLYERHGYRFAGRRPAPAYPGGRGSSEWLLLTKPHG